MPTGRTKALAISKEVKAKVYERDGGCCVWCGSPQGQPNAHYIPRSRSGLGVEKNILTLCWPCHLRYDQTTEREKMGAYFREYLQSKYPDWNEEDLYYRKNRR